MKTLNATLLLLLPFLQTPGNPGTLKPGVPVQGEVTGHSQVVETPTLKQGYTDGPVVGETFTFQVPESGSWHLDLRSCFLDTDRVVRDGGGTVLGEDDDGLIGVHARIVAELEAGREYRVTACALHGQRGHFELVLAAGRPAPLSPPEKAAADLADARSRVRAMEGAEVPESVETASALNTLASALYKQGKYEEAGSLLVRTLEIREKVLGPDHALVATSLNNLAILYQAQGGHGEAEPLFKRALQGQLSHLDRELPVMTEADRFQLLGVTEGPGRLLKNTTRLETGADRSVLDLCLQLKGKATRLQAAGLKLAQEEESPEVRRRIGELQGLQKELSTLVFLPASQRAEDHEERVASLRKKRLDLERTLNRDLGLDKVLATPASEEVQAALPADAVLLDFYVDKEAFVWVMKHEGPPKLVALGEVAGLKLRERQEALLAPLVTRGGAPLEAASPGKGTYEALWAPLADSIGDADLVIVSPSGFLKELPFGILQDGDGVYLIEKHRFVYLSDATRVVGRGSAGARRLGGALFVGAVDYGHRGARPAGMSLASALRSLMDGRYPPLPGTAREVEALAILHAQTFPGGEAGVKLTGAGASEERVRHAGLQSLGEERRAVGLLPGFLTGLVLAGVNAEPDPKREDGYLSAEEIQYLDLSACETALGSKRAGEGLQSLRRGFAVAGAKTVVSSFWKVNDQAAATLMRHFYENYWQKGMEKLDALHAAKLRMLAQSRSDYQGDARPSTWGAFVLSGDWR
ncbi:MAG: CHAT domain-containing protein [Planctomycetota bacterium]